MKLILKFSVLFVGLFLTLSVFARTFDVGVLQDAIGAGGYDKTLVKRLWETKLLPTLNDSDGGDRFEVRSYGDINELKKALKDNTINYAYAQSPAMIKEILLSNPKVHVVSTLLTEDPKTKTPSTSYDIYLFTAKNGLNISSAQGLRKKLAAKKVAITFNSFHAATLIQKALSGNQIKWIETRSFMNAVHLVESGKADATFATIRAGYFSKKDWEKLVTVAVIKHPNGALVSNEEVSMRDSTQLATTLQSVPASNFNGYLVKGFGDAYSREEYLAVLSQPTFD